MHMAVILGVAIAITFLLMPLNVYPGLPSEAGLPRLDQFPVLDARGVRFIVRFC